MEQASQDPYLLRQYGDLWTQLQGAKALAHQVTAQVQQAWDQGDALTHGERGAVAISASTAKTLAITTGLTITQQIFELMGAIGHCWPGF